MDVCCPDLPNAHIAAHGTVFRRRSAMYCLNVRFVIIKTLSSCCTHVFAQPCLYRTGPLILSRPFSAMQHIDFDKPDAPRVASALPRQITPMYPHAIVVHVARLEENSRFSLALQHVRARRYLVQRLRAAFTRNQELTRICH